MLSRLGISQSVRLFDNTGTDLPLLNVCRARIAKGDAWRIMQKNVGPNVFR